MPLNSTTVANNDPVSSNTSEDTKDIGFEDVLESDAIEVNNSILTQNKYVNSIINNRQVLEFSLQMAKTVELALEIKDITDYNYNYNHNPLFIFDTEVTVYVISNKSWFLTYKQTHNLVSWGQVKTPRVQGEGSCKIKFLDSNIIVIFRKCYYIPELGINIIAGIALPLDVAWIGNNNTLVIIRDNKFITKANIKNGLYYLPVTLILNNINITIEILHKRFAYIN